LRAPSAAENLPSSRPTNGFLSSFQAAQVSELCLAQMDDGPPTAVAAGRAPGESGVIVLRARFKKATCISARRRRRVTSASSSPHVLTLNAASPVRRFRTSRRRARSPSVPPVVTDDELPTAPLQYSSTTSPAPPGVGHPTQQAARPQASATHLSHSSTPCLN
jgi:hypothetical protein